MAEFGPKVTAAAGIAASFPSRSLGDKFGGNGPLFAAALHDIHDGKIDVTYIGALGDGQVLPIFHEALSQKTKRLYTIANAAPTTCLEFTDGKLMLNDMSACAEITLERLLERVGESVLDEELKTARFIGALNWGKLPYVGPIWSYISDRLTRLGAPLKEVYFFMDLADFENRSRADIDDVLSRVEAITRQCNSVLSLNLKEARQMSEHIGDKPLGNKDPESIAELAVSLQSQIAVDRVIIHRHDGAACASALGSVYVAGPYCREPLISTGAGDNFGAGCLSGALMGLDDAGIILAGVCAGGYFVRSGRSASFADMAKLLAAWADGSLGDRL